MILVIMKTLLFSYLNYFTNSKLTNLFAAVVS